MKPKKITVTRGITYRAKDEGFHRFSYKVEALLDNGEDLTAARGKLVENVNGWLKQDISQHSQSPLGGLDPAHLDALPWKPYREGHRAAWIFSDTRGAETLAEAIKQSKTGKVELGGFFYKFSGPEENPSLFISRTPVKGDS